ncbi:MAG TPA: imidazole glycerol phosphate synthase subunit HisH [Longimicrobiales bacterium]|nr:imidazole glycerol phosphate synthase subunit HisH [Longimicrobiales bacterium]
MMRVAVIDYGTGNLHSLVKALEIGGADVWIERDLNRALDAQAIVLPGVGAFGAAAAQLSQGAPALHEAISNGKPCLGICLGMQLLFERSEEGTGSGLSALSGSIRRLHGRRVPHMGWNDVEMVDDALFAGISELLAYYANSYIAVPADESEVIAWSRYGSERFAAAVRRDSVWGVQFHPEKSGRAGLQVLHNFLAQVPA